MGYQDIELRSMSCIRIFFNPVNPKRFNKYVLGRRMSHEKTGPTRLRWRTVGHVTGLMSSS
jgi:hypothetical protein